MDRKALSQLISLSQSKLTFERDPDTSTCLRKAVLVQNCLRRTSLYPAEDDDSMMMAGISSAAETASLSTADRASSARRPLYRGTPYGEAAPDEDDSEAHVPEMLFAEETSSMFGASISSGSSNCNSGASMIVDTIMAESQYISQTVLEISPPPSPDALNQDVDEDVMDMTLQAEILRRSTLVRKSSVCAMEGNATATAAAAAAAAGGSTCSSLDIASMGAAAAAGDQPPSKRPRLFYDAVAPMFDAVH